MAGRPVAGGRNARLEEEEAQDYAAAIRSASWIKPDWHAKNADIIDRFSRTALLRIKRRAWQIIEQGSEVPNGR